MKTSYMLRLAPAAVAIADVSKMGSKLYEINRINVPPVHRGRGHGRELLKQIITEANTAGVVLRLAVNPSGGLGRRKLTAWYARNAFIQRDDGYMYREPAAPCASI